MSSTVNANTIRPAPLVIPAKIDSAVQSVKQTTMSAANTITQVIANLSIAEIDSIDTLVLLLKEKKRTLKTERTNLLQVEKAAERAVEKARKDAEKEAEKAAEKAAKEAQRAIEKSRKEAEKTAEKAAKKAAKDEEKAKEKRAQDGLKEIKKQVALDAGVVPKAKNSYYLNFIHWAKDNGPSEETIAAAGGRRTWLKNEWAKLTKSEKEAPDAPWNVGHVCA